MQKMMIWIAQGTIANTISFKKVGT
jgi:hypothetical protein